MVAFPSPPFGHPMPYGQCIRRENPLPLQGHFGDFSIFAFQFGGLATFRDRGCYLEGVGVQVREGVVVHSSITEGEARPQLSEGAR
jgi:hypothetical protein